MKKKQKLLVALMALTLAGGVGSALAATYSSAANKTGTGGADQAIYLYWTTGSSSTTITGVSNLTANVPQYRCLTVQPKSTKTVTGTVKLTFGLAAKSGNYHIKGLTVKVYEIAAAFANPADGSTLITTASLPATSEAVVSEGSASDTVQFAVAASTEEGSVAHTTTHYYAIEFKWDGSIDSSHKDWTLEGTLTVSQAFAA